MILFQSLHGTQASGSARTQVQPGAWQSLTARSPAGLTGPSDHSRQTRSPLLCERLFSTAARLTFESWAAPAPLLRGEVRVPPQGHFQIASVELEFQPQKPKPPRGEDRKEIQPLSVEARAVTMRTEGGVFSREQRRPPLPWPRASPAQTEEAT